MSGIAGIIRLDGAPVLLGEIEATLAAMARRGPDRRGSWHRDNAALGHVLLATTPEAICEHQPWEHPASGVVVVSDSRLDNRPQLLQDLGFAGRDPDTIGDGELLHAAFARWGEDCAARLLGDFSFVLWDPRGNKVFAARDVMGVRPFCYHFSPGRLFAFASDADALLEVRGVPTDLDEGRIADALVEQLEGIDKTSTFYSAIQRLPPANTLTVSGERLDCREYWTPMAAMPSGLPTTENGWIEGLRDRLTTAVSRRLRSSGRVGSMLSGGLDSSSIVALACQQTESHGSGPFATFSAVSTEPGCPETRAIESMLAQFACDASRLSLEDAGELLDSIAAGWPTMGEPFDAGMTLIDCQYLSAARRGVRVVLDGIDGDNLLSEGDYLQRLARSGRWVSLLREIRGQKRFYGDALSTWASVRPHLSGALVPPALRRIVRRGRDEREYLETVRSTLIAPDLANRIDLAGRLRRLRDELARQRIRSPDGQAGTSMTLNYTTVGVERYGRVAAARGIEPRHPFLDRDLIEFCAWIPWNLRLRDGWPKWILRQAMASTLPADVAWRLGKEHLGWRFNHALLGRIVQQRGFGRDLLGASLGNYVAVQALRDVSGTESAWSEKSSRWETIFGIAALQAWFAKRRRL
jgi:asparagine synthase (glutamine-hydrolysing)